MGASAAQGPATRLARAGPSSTLPRRNRTPSQMVPSSGAASTSLWDTSDPDELQKWLVRRAPAGGAPRPRRAGREGVSPTARAFAHRPPCAQDENVNVDCKHAVFEVQEEFAIGLGDVLRQRTADKVATGTAHVAERTGKVLGQAATSVSAGVTELDSRLKISATAKTTVDHIKDSKVAQNTAAVRGGRAARHHGAACRPVGEVGWPTGCAGHLLRRPLPRQALASSRPPSR